MTGMLVFLMRASPPRCVGTGRYQQHHSRRGQCIFGKINCDQGARIFVARVATFTAKYGQRQNNRLLGSDVLKRQLTLARIEKYQRLIRRYSVPKDGILGDR
jgi:hypothetical protein